MKSGRGREKIKVLQALLVGVSLCLFIRNPVFFLDPQSLPASSVGLVTTLVVRQTRSPSSAAPSPFSAPVLSLPSQALSCPSGGAVKAAGDSRPQVERCPLIFLQDIQQPTHTMWCTLTRWKEEHRSLLLAASPHPKCVTLDWKSQPSFCGILSSLEWVRAEGNSGLADACQEVLGE